MRKIILTLNDKDYIDFLESAQECEKLSVEEMIYDLINYYIIVQRNKEKIRARFQKKL
ncbi:hypothetical protein [Nitrosopumilus sp. b1]|uniref:hypothetical protein n=1 Tax=Nitrosopumilus sp. b1 TaxID=2109907 RepID=UPI0015F3A28C|nr:hypothetical protein [Nitrosopumilus sp. b1]